MKPFFLENFTSLNFNSLFQCHLFPISTQITPLDKTKHIDTLVDCITNIGIHVDNHGGFTDTGCYKKGRFTTSLTNSPVSQLNREL